MTDFCIHDCAYCINRRSSAVARARFSVDEVVTLTLEFYRRNYIEGLFLSSGIIRSPDATMEDLIRIVRNLREVHRFNGYVHLKTIPDASPELVADAGRHANRLSINVELPSAQGMAAFAPAEESPDHPPCHGGPVTPYCSGGGTHVAAQAAAALCACGPEHPDDHRRGWGQ